ncbi:hypothetical protein D6853_04190 [Butyrivibrio sp. X503]|uniref:hypothetical protein n=1 Tax=Butyrivibrio sp. X503 TaxID=2364878 RepID=UPI000EA96225|nr:hypothetical protein [Butyrivibrio sp. X503]RKM57223.1 hypothetical protein D6853_04190 [Butyrivibrio sp. X503]
MKLKYYLRGIGIGVILTALIMGFALGGRKATISDAEVIERAKKLGMVQGGVLTDYSNEENSIDNKKDSSLSDEKVSEEGEEKSEEIDEAVTLSSSPISKVDKSQDEVKKEEVKKEEVKNEEAKSVASSSASSAASIDNSNPKAEAKESKTDNSKVENKDSKTDNSKAENKDSKTDNSNESKSDTEQVNSDVPVTGEAKSITIPGGTSSDGVARILYNEGIIDDPVSFNKYLVDNKIDRIIRSGTKSFPEGATYEQVASIITK